MALIKVRGSLKRVFYHKEMLLNVQAVFCLQDEDMISSDSLIFSDWNFTHALHPQNSYRKPLNCRRLNTINRSYIYIPSPSVPLCRCNHEWVHADGMDAVKQILTG